MDTEGLPTDGIWKRVWSLRVPQRIRTFLWITLQQRHLTNAERFRRHLATSAMCPICYLDVEDLDHILLAAKPAQSTASLDIYELLELSFRYSLLVVVER
ncbi:hypothetical protein V6N13_116220 [Hibiscus sabdariffa]